MKDWYKGESHKKEILQCWIDYIHKNECGDISIVDDLLNTCGELPYQFLHRTASACFNCEHPILIYQLFYDKKDIGRMNRFETLLQQSAKSLKIKANKLPFYIIENEVIGYPKKWKGDASGIFNEMKQNPQYQISDSIVILDGYTLKRI